MASLTVYPAAGDGFAQRDDGVGWNSTITNAGTGANATGNIVAGAQYTAGVYTCLRAFLPFDTSALGSGATVTAATLNVYVYFVYADSGEVGLVSQTQASTSTLAATDYLSVGSTEYATRVTVPGTVATNAYLAIPLTGLSVINKTGFTKLALRSGTDIDASWSPVGDKAVGIAFRASEQAGTSNDPYLDITYTPAPAGATPPRRTRGLYTR